MTTNFSALPQGTRDNFDTGPLSWVIGEIREALASSRTALLEASTKEPDGQSTLMRHAKTYLHQAHGALQLVDADGAVLLTEVSENLLAKMESGEPSLSSEHAQLVGSAYQALVEYLEELLSGVQPQPVRLFPYYKSLLELCGAERIHPADLFFPNLALRPQAAISPPAVDGASSDYAVLRLRFEKGLLSLLKSSAGTSGWERTDALRAVLTEVVQAQTMLQARQFWSVILGFIEAVSVAEVLQEVYVKQLFGRINLQIRRLVDGSFSIPEGLMRDALFFIARTEKTTPLTAQIRSAYQLDGLVPTDYERPRYGQTDVEALRLAKDALTQAKSLWSRIAGGDSASAAPFGQKLKEVAELSGRLHCAPLSKLLRELDGIARIAMQSAGSDSLGMEIATSLLFAENALDHLNRLAPDFGQRAEALTSRLLALAAGETPQEPGQWLDELTQQAQQRQTNTAVAAEMKTSLGQVEKLLDDYFHDHSKRAALAGVGPLLHQIAGVLAILGQDDAMRAVEHTQAAVQSMTETAEGDGADDPAQQQLLHAVAQNIGALSFFIEMLPQDPEGTKKRFAFDPQQGIFRSNLLDKNTASQTVFDPDIPELEVPAQVIAPAAEPIVTVPPVAEEVAAVAAPAAAAPTPAAAAPVGPASDDAIDAELLEIFISEAEEVLAFVAQTLPQSRTEPHNQDRLTTLRRSFHTLKGSGRMVGLSAFGEAASSIEQVMNLWLAEVRSGTADLYALLEQAAAELGAWVAELQQIGQSARSGLALIAAAERVKAGQPYSYEDATAAPADAAPADAVPADAVPADAAADSAQANDAVSADVPELTEPVAAEPASPVAPAAATDAAAENVITFPGNPAPLVASDDNLKRIGELEISVPLFNIYLAETDEIVRQLARDFSEWRHEPERNVSTEAVHAAHKLCGCSGTVGFKSLQELARTLEMTLQGLASLDSMLLDSEYDMLEQSVQRLKQMLQKFALGEMAAPEAELMRDLRQLQQQVEARATARASEPEPGIAVLEAEAATVEPIADEPAAAEPAAAIDSLVGISDHLDPDLLPVFLEEGADLLPQIGQALRSWRQQPAETGVAQAVLRLLHTLKGSARMAGAMRLGEHAHEMETRIQNIVKAGAVPPEMLEELLVRHDQSMHLFELLQQPASAGQPAAATTVTTVDARDGSGSAAVPAETEASIPLAAAAATSMVRVRADILDRLVNQAGEVSITRSKLETEVRTLRQSLSELTENMVRLRGQLREVEIQAETQISSSMGHASDREFDPLEFDRFTRLQELTRMMAESVNDVSSLQDTLVRTVDSASADLTTQARLTRELQQDLMRVRMVPFSSVAERLYHLTRQTAKELGKRINFDIRGAGVEMDRGVLEKMIGPFEHLLRNAIVHGIETREQRLAAGKNETGELLLEVRQEGNEVVIRFDDDGQGLNLERIREQAKARGLLTDEHEVSDAEAADFIIQPGFSTASEVTALAGRGVGMDVVRSEAAALGGRVAITSERGKGAHFTIHLPLTLAVTQVVLLKTGGATYAVPSVLVEQVQQLKSPQLAAAYNDGAVQWQDQRVPMYYLPALLGDSTATPAAQQYAPLLVMKSGNNRVAIHVDEVLGNREVVVKNIGPQLARMAGIAGATVLGSGDIILILNPVPLAQRAAQLDQRAPRLTPSDAPATMGAVADMAPPSASGAEAVDHSKSVVMVVDDSLTVRKVTQRLLTREGYQVLLAKDGIDALEQLQTVTPDVMLVDIEMPRMDGFDLTRNVRNDERSRSIPIIMITSRTADKHRNYAKQLGVDAYFGKPFQEEELLAAIAGFIGKK
jgi:chemosensory pili system protein ChpA (sensor histidine kinase/response regulator)